MNKLKFGKLGWPQCNYVNIRQVYQN